MAKVDNIHRIVMAETIHAGRMGKGKGQTSSSSNMSFDFTPVAYQNPFSRWKAISSYLWGILNGTPPSFSHGKIQTDRYIARKSAISTSMAFLPKILYLSIHVPLLRMINDQRSSIVGQSECMIRRKGSKVHGFQHLSIRSNMEM